MTTQSHPGWNVTARRRRGPQARRSLWLLVMLCACLLALPATAQAGGAGDFDPTFASDGQLRLQLGRDPDVPGSSAHDVALQSDGKLVLGGVAGDPEARNADQFMVARLNANGTVDTTFGSGGSVQLQLADALAVSHVFQNGQNLSEVNAVAIQPDGKIIAAGSAVVGAPARRDNHQEFALVRLNSDGSLDPSFGSGGTVHVQPDQPGARINDIALQPDGKIIAAGFAQDDTTNDGVVDLEFAAVRLNPDGSLDVSFGDSGKVLMQVGAGLFPSRPGSAARSVVLQPDGRIVLAGSATDMLGNHEFALARLNPDGSPDTSFGDTGRVRTQVSDADVLPASGIGSVALTPDGKLIAGGAARDPDSDAQEPGEVALARFNSDGALDTSFGSQGKVLAQMSDDASPFSGFSEIALQSDGKIVGAGAAGDSSPTGATVRSFLVARFNANGSVDDSFGTAGKVTAQMGEPERDFPAWSNAWAVAVQPDNRIVAAGNGTYPGPADQIGVVRVLGGPGPVASFDVAPAEPKTGEAVTFTSTSSVPGGGSIVRAEWDLGEGFVEGPAQVSHTFAGSGNHSVSLRVTGDDGQTERVTRQVTVANRAPAAAFVFAPAAPKTGESVTFDGSGSGDPDGSVTAYAWDFGDGTTGSGTSPSHAYARAGSYAVKLTVTDDDGSTASVSRTVTVANRAPSAAFGFAPAAPRTGESVSFDGSGSGDPDGSVAAYAWDFGDGTTASGARPSHSYAQAGSYSVRLTVTDDEGASASVSRTVTVGTRAVRAAFSFSPSSPSTGQAVSFDGSASSVDGGAVSGYSWTFGDGATASGAAPTHTYAKAGSYTVTLTATGADGASDSVSHTVTVANRLPLAAISATPSSPLTGQQVTFNASGSSDPDGAIAAFDWDLDGDGAYETDTGTNPTTTRSYARSGPVTVRVRVRDDNGASATASRVVDIADRPPLAALTAAPNPALVGQAVTFDASGSDDPDGTITRYEWDLDGDGSHETNTATTPRTSRAYEAPRAFAVGVRVSDDRGGVSQTSLPVRIDAKPSQGSGEGLPVEPGASWTGAGDAVTPSLALPPFVGSLAFPRGQTPRALLRRGIAVVVRCSRPCRAAVAVTLERTVSGRRAARPLVIARAARQLAGGPAMLNARLSPAAKRLLRLGRRLKAHARVRLTAHGASAQTFTRKLVLPRR